ncbi:MAG: hypothetical protein MI741_07180, partial [Rhodospirillales bacterium]|nr:hypothetical protein [Rhodospirillales bacterium]
TQTEAQPSFWPYLIRVRYRIHDTRGEIGSGGENTGTGVTVENVRTKWVTTGMWFEHILPVNRPSAPGLNPIP